MVTTLELQTQIADSFMEWFRRKMNNLMLSIQCPPTPVEEDFRNQMLVFLDDLSKSYVKYTEQSHAAIEYLEQFVKQYPSVSIDERQKAAEMCKQILLLFGVVRKCEVIESKTNRGQNK